MRRTFPVNILTLLVLAAGVATPAMGTNTVSKPAGFSRLVLPPESSRFSAMPFAAADAGVASVFSNQLTGATNETAADRLQRWDSLYQEYESAFKYGDGAWYADFTNFTASDFVFLPGAGFFIANRQQVTQTVFLCGGVVLENASTQSLPSGLSFFGYPFSTARKLNDTSLAASGAQSGSDWTNADQVSIWDSGLGDYLIFALKDSDSLWHSSTNWSGAATEEYLRLGQGQWFNRLATNEMTWTESRPYTHLYPSNSEPPVILGLHPNAQQDEMILSINATGIGVLEIYYKDLSSTGAFTSTGWQIAATNVTGGGTIEWTDDGAGGRGKVDAVEARYYLVGNSLIDDDGDGWPNCREVFVLGTDPASSNTAPTINNAAATIITATSACMNGDLTSTGGLPTRVWLYWGTSDGGMSKSAWSNTIEFQVSNAGQLSTNVQGLVSSATYCYRFYASNSVGDCWAATTGIFSPAPLSVSGLKLWLDATDPSTVIATTHVGYVEEWMDKSGNANDFAQTNASKKPQTQAQTLNGLNMLKFDGGDVLAGVPVWQGGDNFYSLFAVWSTTKTNASQYVFSQSKVPVANGTRGSLILSSSGKYGFAGYNNDAPSIAPYLVNEAHLTVMAVDNYADTNITIYDGGSVYKGKTSVPGSLNVGTNACQVGADGSGTVNLSGGIAEIIVFDRVLSDNERNRVGYYLQQKYGLSGGFTAPSESPIVENKAGASEIGADSARLNGELIQTGSGSAQVWVYWGKTDGGTNVAGWQNSIQFPISGVGSYSTNVQGLLSSATYYYRFAASNSAGMAWASQSMVFSPAPLSVSGLKLWLDAADPAAIISTTEVGYVEGWLDKSGNGNNFTQTNASKKPVTEGLTLSGLNTLYFDGGDVLAGVPVWQEGDDNYSLFAVWSAARTNTSQYVFSQSKYPVANGTRGSLILSSSGKYGFAGYNNDAPSIAPYLVNEAHLTVMAVDNYADTNITIYDGGSVYKGKTSVPGSLNVGTNACQVGADGSGAVNLKGGIAEIVVFDRVLSDDERNRVGYYLQQKYGLSGGYTVPPECPIVQNEAGASGIGTQSATLNGDLCSAGNATTYVTVYWGTTDGATNPAAWNNSIQFPISGVGSYSTNVQGLLSSATYYYRFAASNSAGMGWASESMVFSPAPLSVSGLKLWLDAADPSTIVATTDVGYVEGWLDKSGNANDFAQTNASKKPATEGLTLNGLNTLYFDGGDVLAGVPVWQEGDDNYSLFAVWSAARTNTSQYVFSQSTFPVGNGTRGSLILSSSGKYGFAGYNNDAPSVAPYLVNEAHLTVMAVDNYADTNITIYDGGSVYKGKTSVPGSLNVGTNACQVGADGSGAVNLKGGIAEIVVFDHVLSIEDRNRVGFYLQQKYGLSGGYADPCVPQFFGEIAYSGPQTGAVRVLASTESNGWALTWSVALSEPGLYLLTNVPVGTNLWAKAFRDSNGNGVWDPWEARGEWTGNPVVLSNAAVCASLTLTDPDDDAEGLPDWWELAHFGNLNQTADGDPDSDGLTNIEEYQNGTVPTNSDSDNDGLSDGVEVHTHNTNPLLADTDGDGMPDKWEIDHSLNPLVNDAASDPDGDGLKNLEEYQAGTDIHSADTDDDGVSDYIEVMETGTSPTVSQFDGTTNTVAVIDGSQTNAVNGAWVVSGDEVVCDDPAGWVEYMVQLPTNDIYKLTVEATHFTRAAQCSPVDPVGQSALMIYADGQYLGRRTLTAPGGLYGTVEICTPYLSAGSHIIRVRWDNAHSHVSLKIKALTVQQLGGADSNSNGAKDWVEESLANLNRLDGLHVANSSSNVYNQSWVSPVCVEGPGRSVERMTVTADGVSNTVYHGVGDRWYSDAPLSPTGGTAIAISFEDGALVLTTNITWTALNLLDEGNQLIRKQDALKLTACPEGATNGTVTIEIAGVTNYTTTVDQPVIHTFTNAGTYTVTGIWEGTNTFSNTLTVTVMAASFPTSTPAFLMGAQRTLSLPNVPVEAVLESDETVTLGRLTNGVSVTMNNVSKDHYMTARVGTNGAILANSKLDGFWVQAAVDSYMWVVEDYGDSQLWENVLVAKHLPAGVDIQISIFIAGVTFDDMTTERWITAADLNAIGEYRFRMIHPDSVGGSVCHTIKMYQDGKYLGEAYYSGLLMPTE